MKIFRIFFIILLVSFLVSDDSLMAAGEEQEDKINNKDIIRNSDSSGSVIPGLYTAASLYTRMNGTDIVGGCVLLDVWYRSPLNIGTHKLFGSSKVDIGIQEFLTPSFNRISGFIKVEPVPFFDLKVRLGHDYIFDFYSVEGPGSDYSDREMNKTSKSDLHPRSGIRGDVIPTFKYAHGMFVMLYSFTMTYHDYGYDGYYYDHNTYIIHKGKDLFYTHDLKLLLKLDNIMIGPHLEHSLVGSSSKSFIKSELFLVYFPAWGWLDSTTKPFLSVSGGTYLKDRYRKGSFEYSVAFGCNCLLY